MTRPYGWLNLVVGLAAVLLLPAGSLSASLMSGLQSNVSPDNSWAIVVAPVLNLTFTGSTAAPDPEPPPPGESPDPQPLLSSLWNVINGVPGSLQQASSSGGHSSVTPFLNSVFEFRPDRRRDGLCRVEFQFVPDAPPDAMGKPPKSPKV